MVKAFGISCVSVASRIAKHLVFHAFATIVLASLVATTL